MNQRPRSAVQRLPEIAMQRPTSADSAVKLQKEKLQDFYDVVNLTSDGNGIEEKIVSGAQFRSTSKG